MKQQKTRLTYSDKNGVIEEGPAPEALIVCIVQVQSFEVPAFGVRPPIERAPEHEQLFRRDGHAAVAYFDDTPRMVETARRLRAEKPRRRRLANGAQAPIAGRDHTYSRRLVHIVESASLACAVRPHAGG